MLYNLPVSRPANRIPSYNLFSLLVKDIYSPFVCQGSACFEARAFPPPSPTCVTAVCFKSSCLPLDHREAVMVSMTVVALTVKKKEQQALLLSNQ